MIINGNYINQALVHNYYIDSLIWPDIPLTREISKTKDELVVGVVNNVDEETLENLKSVKNLSVVFNFNESRIESPDIQIIDVFKPTIYRMENIKIMGLPRKFFNGSTGLHPSIELL